MRWWGVWLLDSVDGRLSCQSVGEMLCLKTIPQFLSHLIETCYTWSLWRYMFTT